MLENSFLKIIEYVELDNDNYNTYSIQLINFIQACGSELDNCMKEICQCSHEKNVSMKNYFLFMKSNYPHICKEKVDIIGKNIKLCPFEKWNEDCPSKSLTWWLAYTDIKHNRIKNYKEANLENALNILAAIYIVEMNYYKIIVERDEFGTPKEPDRPDVYSKLFKLEGWQPYSFPIEGLSYVEVSTLK